MANAAFDTLTVSKDLQEAGFEARQAEAIALAVNNAQGDLATKQDIALLKSDIDNMRDSISWLKWIAGANFALSSMILGAIIVL